MKDIMIDLETIDTKTTAGILSIGAVVFDLKTEDIGESFVCNMGYNNAVRNGSKDRDTINWWKDQDLKVFNKQFYPENSVSINDALRSLYAFIDLHIGVSRVIPWSNGSCFDITILTHKYENLGLNIPWEFFNVRDVRTICSIANVHKGDMVFEGSMHDPIDDCIHQIKMVQGSYWKLTK